MRIGLSTRIFLAVLALVRRAARATHRLAAGHHEVRVQAQGHNESGQLARDFNHLVLTLERNEALRGELADDLFELALSDAGALSYRMAPLDLGALLQRAVETHRARIEASGLALELSMPLVPMPLQGDEARLLQLLDTLLENSRRYTDAPGVIRVGVQPRPYSWQINVHDSAPGLPPALLPRLFECFFCAEGSRSQASGGAGLGLALCRNIVLAHGGRIEARPSGLGGVWMQVEPPRPETKA
jgi:two-component system sensor histidine kinase BaeS